ncbi:aspartic endopeptidase [Xylariaceae sp. FL0016]|nr:aspartic endopeptidase [Xylariaceae sp. FL0016]
MSSAGPQKIKVIRNENYQRHGLKSYVYLMNRFGFESTKAGPYCHIDRPKQTGLVPEGLRAAVGGRVRKERVLVKKTGSGDDAQHGQVTAEDQQNDSEYLCKVSVGTPGQDMLLDFDTGSADLWMINTEVSKANQQGHNVFDPKKSSTYKKLDNLTWEISYGDGSSASGDCGSDTVTIGGISVENQTLELAKKLSAQFAQGTGDGLLGLAFSTINTVKKSNESDPQKTPVENMIKQQDIKSSLFTSCFYSSRDKKKDESFYTFGSIDQDLVKSSGEDITYTKIDNSQGFWMFNSESASINGKSIALSGNMAIADTGTTLALVSDEVVEALYKAIPGAKYDETNQGYIFPTSTKVDDLPEFKVAVGDKEFVIQKEDLAFTTTEDGKHWYGGVQSRGTMTFDILGDTFLKSVYCIWDVDNLQFGLVPKLETTQNLTPPSTSSTGSGEKKVTSVQLISNL